MHWVYANERNNEYEVSIDHLPPYMEENELCFDQGNLITGTLPMIDYPFTLHPEEYMTDNIVAATETGLVINKKIKDIFDGLNIKNIQYFPANLLESNSGTSDRSYCFANIVGKYACVNHEESELGYFDSGNIRDIESLVLKLDENTEYGHIFRLAEYLPVIIISDELKSALENSNVTGCRFYKPEDFDL